MSNFSLNLDELIVAIQTNVSKMVKEHLCSQFHIIINRLCTQYQLNEAEVVQYLQDAHLLTELDVAGTSTVKCTGKRKVVESEPKCGGFTKAGNPCRYRVVAGLQVCKKHNVKNQTQMNSKNPNVTDLPTEEQAWFDKKTEYQRSFYPQYEKSQLQMDLDLVDDTTTTEPGIGSVFVTDE